MNMVGARSAALTRPIGPAIAVPGVKPRTDGVDFDACVSRCGASSSTFVLPAARIADTSVPDGPMPVNVVERVRYHSTQADLYWLVSAREQLPPTTTKVERAAFTRANFEAIVTSLELVASRNEGLPVGRVNVAPEDLEAAGVVDAPLLKPQSSEVVAAVRRYWAAKRIATENRPLIHGLSFWPADGACPADTPFLSREADIDVWVRKAPTQAAPVSAQREMAEPLVMSFAGHAALLAEALLARETKRLDHTFACIHELASVRAANGIPTSGGCIGDAAAAALAVEAHAGAVGGQQPRKLLRTEAGRPPATPTKVEPGSRAALA